ncbi:hypothetical protein LJ739_01085 [Aestuariibacter halophilus]|uniref:HDOD domain-containing protein n=1 Tax=Fluctibacter halophilus TaxID=226011 RepID=A0ABS8G3Y4_9ALTE|nr:hypothetical protein [Aestuariibacter halophilus]
MQRTLRTTALTPAHVNQILHLADDLIGCLKQSPDQVTAHLFWRFKALPYVTQLSLTSAILGAVTGVRNQFNDTTLQHLVAGLLTLYSFNQAEIERQARQADGGNTRFPPLRPSSRLRSALRHSQLDVWDAVLDIAPSLPSWNGRLSPTALQPVQQVAVLSHRLARMLLPVADQRRMSWAQALSHLALHSSPQWRNWLAPLVDYPGLMPPGSVIRNKSGQTSLVLSVAQPDVIVRSLSGQQQDDIQVHRCQPTDKGLATQSIGRPQRLNQWWDERWQHQCDALLGITPLQHNTYRLDHPPPILLDIQTQLSNPVVDVAKLSTLISTEAPLVSHLLNIASRLNREQLTVKSVHHALMVLGYERANAELIQHALLLRLSQHYFPLQSAFLQFTRLRSILAQRLAGDDITLSLAMPTLATFANTGLFTHPGFKTRTQWRCQQQNALYDITTLHDHTDNASLHSHPLTLAKAWQQPASSIEALRLAATPPREMNTKSLIKRQATLLGLSLAGARMVYFGHSPDRHTETYLAQAFESLDTDHETFSRSLFDAATEIAVNCPLGR